MESDPIAHVKTSAGDDVDITGNHSDAALPCPSLVPSAARKSRRIRPRSGDLGRSGSISRLRGPLDRAADEDGVSAHSRDDPSRDRPWHALALLDERRTCGSALTAPATSQHPRSTRAGASEIASHRPRPCDRSAGARGPRRPASLVSCPVLHRKPSRRSSGRGGEPNPR